MTSEADSSAQPAPSGEVAVVIPCYAHARFLRRAIESVLGQTAAPKEIIVVDDGSPDRPQRIVADYPQVRLLRQDNRGPSAARNLGLGAASAPRIIFLDADDILLPDAIARGLDCFMAHPDSAFVYGAYAKRGPLRWAEQLRPPATRADLLRENRIGMIGTVMFDRPRLIAIGGFDEQLRLAEDWDLYLRLSRKFPFAAHGHVIAGYTRHRRNVTNDVGRMRRGIEIVRELERARGLSIEERAAWDEGAAVIASAYPPFRERARRMAARIVGVNGPLGPRQ